MNDCEKYTELMSQMLDGELTAEQASELRTHIASCENCRRVFDAFAGVSEALSDGLAEPPEMLTKGVLFKIKNQKKHRRFAYGKFTALAACLALILLGAAKFGFFGGGSGSVSLDSSAGGSAAYSADGGSGTADGSLGAAPNHSGLTREEIKKGVKLEKTDDGTVYQLGFPIQNVQLLEGAKPEEVKKEPAWLLGAKKIEVYKGAWYSEAELGGQTDSAADSKTDSRTDSTAADDDQRKNDHITTVTDDDTLDEIDALLTSVPDDTTELTVDSKEFTDADPVCTLYIAADKSTETAQPGESESPAGTSENRTSAASAGESRTNSFRESLESVKNSLLNKTDDAKASPSPSADTDGSAADAKPVQRHDITISIYYVKGEIWCVARRVNDDTAPADTQTDSTKADKTETSAKPAASARTDSAAKGTVSEQPSPSASPTAEADSGRILPVDRILYKAAGTPEKMDALLKKLESAGSVLLTESVQKKDNG